MRWAVVSARRADGFKAKYLASKCAWAWVIGGVAADADVSPQIDYAAQEGLLVLNAVAQLLRMLPRWWSKKTLDKAIAS